MRSGARATGSLAPAGALAAAAAAAAATAAGGGGGAAAAGGAASAAAVNASLIADDLREVLRRAILRRTSSGLVSGLTSTMTRWVWVTPRTGGSHRR